MSWSEVSGLGIDSMSEGGSFASGSCLTMDNWNCENKTGDKGVWDYYVWLNDVIHMDQFEVIWKDSASNGRESQHSNVLNDTTVFTSP